MVMMTPSWTMNNRTGKQLESEIGNGFKFKGAGWYFTDTDTALIVEVDDPTNWSTSRAKRYNFLCWNAKGIREFLSALLSGPIRVDERS